MSQLLPKAVRAALQFEHAKLPNGLEVRVMALPGYSATHAIYATKFGSIHRRYIKNNKEESLPAGVAHFLEHKMFENEDGMDAFTLFAATGASANAYTGFDATSYIFTASSEIDKNLDILLSFVGRPYFTQKTVQKEQGIIGQEIKMYDDHPGWRQNWGLLQCLYANHPIREDIAGTVQSIAGITPEVLYGCTDAFYNPANMSLCVAGDTSLAQVLAAVERAGLPAGKQAVPEVLFPQEPSGVAKQRAEISMAVALPLFAYGFKEQPLPSANPQNEVVGEMLAELIAGETGPLYRKLYDEGLVQADFSGDYSTHKGCAYFMFSGESEDPARVKKELFEEIERLRKHGVDAEQFALCKKMMYGEIVASLENPERVAGMLSGSYMRGRTPQQELEAIAGVTLDEVNEALQTMLQEEKSAEFIIWPAEK